MTESIYQPSVAFRRLAAASAVASLFAFALTVTITPAAINQISPLCHNSDTLVGWLFRVSMIGFFGCVLLGGRYSDRQGKLPILCLGCTLMAIGSFAFAHSTSYPMAVLTVLLMGMGGGFTEAISMAVVADAFSPEKRTSVMNFAQVSFAAGAVLGPLGVSWLLSAHIDWRWSYMLTGLLCIPPALTALAAAARREERRSADEHSGAWKPLLRDPLVVTLSIGILLYVAAEGGQASWVAKFFKQDLRSSGPVAAATVAFFWGGIGVGRLIAMWTSRHLSDYAIICFALAIGLVSQIALLVTHSPVPALVLVPLIGFGLGPAWPTIVSRASALHPRQSGTVLGIVVSAGALGAAIFPAAIGQAADHFGLRQALWTCVVLLVSNLFIFIVLWRRNRAR